MRIILGENKTARVADQTGEYVPAAGSGVAESTGRRTFDLTWQLRDTLRSDSNTPVISGTQFNVTGSTGIVDNAATLGAWTSEQASPSSTPNQTDTDDDTIVVLDPTPSVTVSKTVASQKVVVPQHDSGVSGPTNTYTLTATNNGNGKLGNIRVTDPAPCDVLSTCAQTDANADPFLEFKSLTTQGTQPNPFDRQDVTGISVEVSQPNQVDLTQSTVWLRLYDEDTKEFSWKNYKASDLGTLSTDVLKKVVGVSVTFTGTQSLPDLGSITKGTTVTVKISTILRTTLRSDPTTYADSTVASTDVTSPNTVFAQAQNPAFKDSPTNSATADVVYSGGVLDVKTTKTISDGSIVETDPTEPQTVTLTASNGSKATMSPDRVVVTDQPDCLEGSDTQCSSAFWRNFDFVGFSGGLGAPAGADRVTVDAFVIDADGTGTWKTGTATTSTDPKLPEGVSPSDVAGLRFTFTRSDGKALSASNDPQWSATITYTAKLREQQRGSSDTVTFPGKATDVVTAQSFGPNGRTSSVATASAPVEWSTGTHVLAIDKLANNGKRSVKTGDLVPWTITIRNAGTGYLDLTSVSDAPESPDLIYTGVGPNGSEPWTFAKDPSMEGILTTAPTMAQEDDGTLTFTWPDGARMLPNEQVTITVYLELETSIFDKPEGQRRATNEVTVSTEQALSDVIDAHPGNGADTVSKTGDNSGMAEDYIEPSKDDNLFPVKGVATTTGTATNSLTGQACEPTLDVDGKKYFRYPCVADSQYNASDDWVLEVTNVGSTAVTDMVLVDQLPVPGDKLIATGNDRGSTYRAVLDSLPNVSAPEGTKVVVETTDGSNVCEGAWDTDFRNGETGPCSASEWVTASEDGTDWSKVTGLRLRLSFAQGLKPGEDVTVTYSSTNRPTSEAIDSGAATDVPVSSQVAMNQFGVQFKFEGDSSQYRRQAPSEVGVRLSTGSIEVTKEATGGAAKYAPATVTATLACTIADAAGADDSAVPLTFDGGKVTKQVTLTKGEDGTYSPERIAGIPVGAECTVSEDGEVGAFGETTRTPADSTTLQVSEADTYKTGASDADAPTNDVPTAQIAKLGNDYQWSGLKVTKKVDTQATTGAFGPFAFEVACKTSNGQDVLFKDASSTTFTLKDGETWTAPESTIPARSTCTITETDKAQADSTAITGDNVTTNGDGSASVNVGTDSASVVSTLVTNHYDSGTFTVAKKVDGSGADAYGSGPFTFQSVCTYQGKKLLDETYTLERNGTKTFGTFPSGTECTTTELKTSGATSKSMSPTDGKVTIAKQSDASTPSSVSLSATNTFGSGSLKVTKKVDGAGAEKFGVGPFTAKVQCTYDKDGTTTPVALQGDGTIELSAANGYSATLTNIIKGAECTVTETDKAGADSSTLAPADGVVTVGGAADPAVEATITNTFEAGYVTVEKKVDGDGAEAYGSGPFSFQSVCTWPGGTGTGGKGGSETTDFTLTGGQSKQLGLYPVGTTCQVSETDAAAATSTTWNPKTQEVTVKTPGDASKPSTAVIIATNTFDVASLTVDKTVVGVGAKDYGAGPFTAKVACTYQKSGETVDVALPDEGLLTLSADNDYSATIDGILKGATCTVEETDLAGADSNAITGDGVNVDGNGVATLVVGDGDKDSAEVTLTNTFKAGYVTVSKTVDGDGAEKYGNGKFSFTSVCTIPDGKGIAGKGGTDTQEFTLKGGQSKQLGLYPVGTECKITEDTTGGATSTAITPENGIVTVADSDDPEVASDVAVSATNTFNVGSVKITKKRIGIGVAEFGDGPFEAQVACTYSKDGETEKVDLPQNGKVKLSKDNGYVATVDGIIAGAECTVTETKNGGADATTLSPADGKVTVGNAAAGESAVEVTITNEFNTVTPPTPSPLPVTGAPIDYLVLAAGALALGGGVLLIRKRSSRLRGAHVKR